MIFECSKCGHNTVDIVIIEKEWLCNYCREEKANKENNE